MSAQQIYSGISTLYRVTVDGPDRVRKNPEWERRVLAICKEAIKSESQTIDGTHYEVAYFESMEDAERARERLIDLFAGSM